jgi:hypothetical protein
MSAPWRLSRLSRFRLRTLLVLIALVCLAMPALVILFRDWQWEREYRRKLLLIKAAERGDTASVRRLLDEGIDINATVNGRYPWTPLMHAAFEGHEQTVRALLDRGANPNHEDRDGAMAITVAAGRGRWAIVRLLAGRGADPRRKGALGSPRSSLLASEGCTTWPRSSTLSGDILD